MARNVTSVITRENDSAKVDMYTVPAKNTAEIHMIYILATVGNADADLSWYDSHSATEYPLAHAKTLQATNGEYLLLTDLQIDLKENDILRVQNSDTASTITYMVSMNLAPSIATQFHSQEIDMPGYGKAIKDPNSIYKKKKPKQLRRPLPKPKKKNK